MSEQRPTLNGRYELEGRLGEGGMAAVFRGTDNVLGRTVAVKVLAPRFAGDSTFVQRFRREAQAAARLNHPNVVGVFDTGSDNNVHYIVMEYVEGRTLEEVLRQEGRLQPERAVEVAESVAAALSFAHREGLVHRDIKPANIMITRSGEVKVMDFGIARITSTETLTQTATVLGTASYLSPEQAQGEAVDARSDIYSLGVVLYEMLTGQVPFIGETAVAVAYKHVREVPTLPTRIEPRIPRQLEAVVMKALAKNPANRYGSADEFRRDLERVRHGEPVAATPVLPAEQSTQIITEPARQTTVLPAPPMDEEERERRRWPAIVIISLLVLLLLGVLGFFLISSLLGGDETENVEVPDVIGFQQAAAEQEVRDAGLVPQVVLRPSNRAEGTVFRQVPAPGRIVEEGSTVRIVVSRGVRQVEVPMLVGLTQDEAEDAIRGAGLVVGFVDEEESEEVEAGRVISQRPEPGTQIPEGSAVDIVVSTGAGQVAVPDIECLTFEQAEERLDERDLVLEVVEDQDRLNLQCPDTEHVADQEPAAGELVDRGTTVTAFVIETVPETSPPITETPTNGD